ncbi:MAG: acetylxylan esterase [Anaerolineae bacterium]|nr:acetylxylan esterase [Anaerolineae bacterium]
MNFLTLRREISDFLKSEPFTSPLPFETKSVSKEAGYDRFLITYSGDEEDEIPAYFLVPDSNGPFPALLIHHQHHSQRHFGKSEVCGLVGDPLQAFGPALAKRGLVILAPDSICFEDRRRNRTGLEPDESADALQHFIELSYRLVTGDTLMRKVLDDASRAVSILYEHPAVDNQRIGSLGHSYGGNTVLFQAALDERLTFACASGAACTYKNKMSQETGIELAEIIPGFAARFDIQDLVNCIAPRKLLLVSATEDIYSLDADWIEAQVRSTFADQGVDHHFVHFRYDGDHALTQARFDAIVDWITECCE